MGKKILSFLMVILFIVSFGVSPVWSSEDEAAAKELTLLLKTARAVLVQNKPLIKDPKGAGIGVDKFMAITYAN